MFIFSFFYWCSVYIRRLYFVVTPFPTGIHLVERSIINNNVFAVKKKTIGKENMTRITPPLTQRQCKGKVYADIKVKHSACPQGRFGLYIIKAKD
jgi:hypothetical protein